jgi:ferrous iron transport protein B
MATIYAVDDTGTEEQLTERMQNAVNPQTQKPIFSYATAFSLLVFYLFAMQCMSTLAIVKRETNSWKWPAIQFGYMTLLAYGASALVYQLLK